MKRWRHLSEACLCPTLNLNLNFEALVTKQSVFQHTCSFYISAWKLKGKVCLMKKKTWPTHRRKTHFLLRRPSFSISCFAYFECGKYQIKTGRANCNLKQIPAWNETCRTQRKIQTTVPKRNEKTSFYERRTHTYMQTRTDTGEMERTRVLVLLWRKKERKTHKRQTTKIAAKS